MSVTLDLSSVEDLDVEDLVSLPRGLRYELHGGNLVIRMPTTFWHKVMAGRLLHMLFQAGLEVFQDAGVRGVRPRDCRSPGLGVLFRSLSPGEAECSHLPRSAFRLVVEIVSRSSENGECNHKANWYAARGIPEYWIVDETADRDDYDAVVLMHRLALSNDTPVYFRERSLRLSELEIEYRAKSV